MRTIFFYVLVFYFNYSLTTYAGELKDCANLGDLDTLVINDTLSYFDEPVTYLPQIDGKKAAMIIVVLGFAAAMFIPSAYYCLSDPQLDCQQLRNALFFAAPTGGAAGGLARLQKVREERDRRQTFNALFRESVKSPADEHADSLPIMMEVDSINTLIKTHLPDQLDIPNSDDVKSLLAAALLAGYFLPAHYSTDACCTETTPAFVGQWRNLSVKDLLRALKEKPLAKMIRVATKQRLELHAWIRNTLISDSI